MSLEDKVREFDPSGWKSEGKGKWIAGAVVVLVLVVGLWTSFFQVGAASVGIVLRFGEPVRDVGPGLHFKAPFGVEEVRKVATESQQKAEFGYRTEEADVESEFVEEGYEQESLMLTGDLNVVDVQWAVQYRIDEPRNYLFKVRNADDTFRYMSQAVMREIVGDRTVNEVLTVGRQKMARAFKEDLEALCEEYEIGLRVNQINLQDITPPDPVKPSFDEVNQAQQQMEQRINQAKGEYNKQIPAAKGEAKRTVQQAEGYAARRVNKAQGDVARFNSVYAEYKNAPDVTRKRLFIETMSEVLPKVKKKFISDGQGTSDVLPLLQLDKGKLQE
jgi:membrane protease subunit HflK